MDTQFPNDRCTSITDDTEAQTIMLKYDVLDQVSRKAYPDDTSSSCIVDHHLTHWLLCCRIWGNPDPGENGFVVIAYPKAGVDRFTVQLKLQEFVAGAPRVEARPFFGGGGQN
jgi:hypothetical protein